MEEKDEEILIFSLSPLQNKLLSYVVESLRTKSAIVALVCELVRKRKRKNRGLRVLATTESTYE